MALFVEKYTPQCAMEWDKFVESESINGTFLQTRKFIEYHPVDRFKDHSLLIFKGNKIVAVILACEIVEDEEKLFFAHKGTTFGGIIVSPHIYNATNISELMDVFEEYLSKENFNKIYMKQTSAIFSRDSSDLIDYFLYQRGYKQFSELNYYLRLDKYCDDILVPFSASKRRDYRYSLRENLVFKELKENCEIEEFYDVLQLNLKKLGLSCVHTLDELLDLKFARFDDRIHFFGVYKDDVMIAGSMTFLFGNDVLHTQYLASNEMYLKCYPMDFLIFNLINYAIERKNKYLTFGICTENQGKYINLGLSRFKEGFGTEYCLNKSYEKELSERTLTNN